MALPTVITNQGLQPTPPETLYAQVIALVQAAVPSYTARLPASLVSDIGQTDAYSLAQCDSARVELVNSLTPFTANPFILNQQGTLCGIPPNIPTNTSVFCVFTGTVGYPVPQGMLVTDGTFQYAVATATVIPSSGVTGPVLCIATVTGSWAVPQNTVTAIASSIPVTITLSVNNPNAGTPSQGTETEGQFRSRVIQGYEVTSVGTPNFLYTLLNNIPGVIARLVSVVQISGGGWMVMVGGNGDPYAIAFAIFEGTADISALVGSTINVTAITNAANGIATTDIDHRHIAGDTITIAGASPGAFNGTYTVTAPVTPNSLGLGVNTTGFGTYVGGGVMTPNSRNVVTAIDQPPNTYNIPFVVPPSQTVLVTMTWNTTATNIVSDDAVSLLGAPAIANYINGIQVGQPINIFEIERVFANSVASIIPIPLMTRMIVQVTIRGIVTAPISGTGVVQGDPQSFFSTNSNNITIVQG